jgi:hypothetical protein
MMPLQTYPPVWTTRAKPSGDIFRLAALPRFARPLANLDDAIDLTADANRRYLRPQT